jgi:hypothetical protein
MTSLQARFEVFNIENARVTSDVPYASNDPKKTSVSLRAVAFLVDETSIKTAIFRFNVERVAFTKRNRRAVVQVGVNFQNFGCNKKNVSSEMHASAPSTATIFGLNLHVGQGRMPSAGVCTWERHER